MNVLRLHVPRPLWRGKPAGDDEWLGWTLLNIPEAYWARDVQF